MDDEELAASLDVEPELANLLPELFADLDDLGIRSSDVVDLLAPLELPAQTRFLDFGCGKGAVALALAKTFGWQTRGVEGLAAFVAHAQEQATALGLQERCMFAVGDLRDEVAQARDYDVVSLLALGDVLGDQAATVQALSTCVRPGGFVVVDDAFIKADAEVDPEDLIGCFGYSETIELLCSHGAKVVAEHRHQGDEMMAWLRAAAANIVGRAQDLAADHPELEDALFDFAKRQWEETALLDGPVVGATWVLQLP